jgi:hypothetical protein
MNIKCLAGGRRQRADRQARGKLTTIDQQTLEEEAGAGGLDEIQLNIYILMVLLDYDLLIEGSLARQWVAYNERHNPKSRRTRRADTYRQVA